MAKPDRSLFRRGVESRDVAVMMEAFADGAVLHSPITFKPFEGKEAIARLLDILMQVFQDFRYTDELTAEDGTKALIFRTRVGDRDVPRLDAAAEQAAIGLCHGLLSAHLALRPEVDGAVPPARQLAHKVLGRPDLRVELRGAEADEAHEM